MIELRWDKRTCVLGVAKDGIEYAQMEKVLQYRTRSHKHHVVVVDETLDEEPSGTWSAWKDVPFPSGDE